MAAGVLSKSGVNLTAGMEAYAAVLRAAVPTSIPLTITSGLRTPEEQASAMLAKLSARGPGELYAVYANDAAITELLKLPRDKTTWALAIAKLTAAGTTMSRHLRGGSFDLRTRDLNASQLAIVKANIAATGGRPLVEYDHLHVDLPAKYAALSAVGAGGQAVARAAKTGLRVWLWGSVAVGVLLLAVVANRRLRGKAPAAAPAALPAPAEPAVETPRPNRARARRRRTWGV